MVTHIDLILDSWTNYNTDVPNVSHTFPNKILDGKPNLSFDTSDKDF
jgi:hypothetical protein